MRVCARARVHVHVCACSGCGRGEPLVELEQKLNYNFCGFVYGLLVRYKHVQLEASCSALAVTPNLTPWSLGYIYMYVFTPQNFVVHESGFLSLLVMNLPTRVHVLYACRHSLLSNTGFHTHRINMCVYMCMDLHKYMHTQPLAVCTITTFLPNIHFPAYTHVYNYYSQRELLWQYC